MNAALAPALLLGTWVALAPNDAEAIRLHTPAWVPSQADPTWGVSLRVGPFRPQIAPEGSPQREFFDLQFRQGLRRSQWKLDHNTAWEAGPILTSLHVDYYFLHAFGRLGVSANVGYWSIDGWARRCVQDPSVPRDQQVAVGCTQSTVLTHSVRGNTRTSLTVIPLGLELVYKLDLLMKAFDIPLMPYGRVGVNYHFWWTDAANDVDDGAAATNNTNYNPNNAGRGGTFGFQFTGGLAFNLDFFSPTPGGGIKSFGVVGNHIFVETSYFLADNFGASPNSALNLSALSFFAGLGFDFE